MKRTGRVLSLAITVAVFGAAGWAWLNRQAIYDWTRLRDYDPPAAIVQLADATTMNDDGRHLFYVHHPELNDRKAFNQNCSGFGEETIVLGCYVERLGIYIFDIDDKRLAGVEEVTAAHEMLHAAYERLSEDERKYVDGLTEQAFKSLTDERIKQTIASYRSQGSSVIPNELHSIIGTEVRNIPAELERYYERYFTNRAEVASYSERYEGVLTERRNQSATLELQITGLKHEIDQLEKALSSEQQSLSADRAGVNTQAEADAYNARVAEYNASIRELNVLIRQHNALIEEYKKNALEQQELFNALDSRPTL